MDREWETGMVRWVGCGLAGLVVLLAAGLFLTWVGRHRGNQDRVYCANNLRQLAQFAATHVKPPPGLPRAKVPEAVPPGTVVDPALAPARRLSWIVPALPTFDQKVQPTDALFAQVRLMEPWDSSHNRAVGQTRLEVATCYGNPPVTPAGQPAPTQYVGLSGVGPDSASLSLGPPVPPELGCWRYNGPTPFAAIADGLSSTLMIAETNNDLGPWVAGGPPTVRGLLVGAEEKRPIGVGGQFGGNHPGGGNFAWADGSVRWLRDETDAAVIRALVTIAGGADEDPIPGE